jgi:hypothetical protein
MYRLLMGRESVFVGVLRALKSGEHGQTRRGN